MQRARDRHESEEGAGALLFVLAACGVAVALIVWTLLHVRWQSVPESPEPPPVQAPL